MLTFIELLIGVVVIVGVARYIIKGYSATGVLFVGGLTLLIVSALMGHQVLPASAASTGYTATDIVEYIKILLMSRGGDLGMMIMMLCGFAAYMTHIGANDMVVKLASKPLQYINSPYLLMVAAYFLACLMSLAVSSATGLGVLLMATLFPIMVNVGISRGAAAAIAAARAAQPAAECDLLAHARRAVRAADHHGERQPGHESVHSQRPSEPQRDAGRHLAPRGDCSLAVQPPRDGGDAPRHAQEWRATHEALCAIPAAHPRSSRQTCARARLVWPWLRPGASLAWSPCVRICTTPLRARSPDKVAGCCS
jgi:hypothetical protein